MISQNASFSKVTRLWIKVTAASNSLLEICDFKHRSLRKKHLAVKIIIMTI